MHSRSSISSSSYAATERTYVDNAYNRRLGRVDLPFGSTSQSTTSESSQKTYVDNPYNRRLGRVGKPLGSSPVSKMSNSGSPVCFREPRYNFYEPLRHFDWEDDDLFAAMDKLQKFKRLADPSQSHLVEKGIESVNRHEAAKAFSRSGLTTTIIPDWVKGGEVIDYSDLDIGNKIGGGGFGDVFVAIWQGRQVAVKKLRVQRVSQEKKRRFEEEVKLYSQLEHANIVQFFGVSVTTPNLAIVMEFMSKGSLHDVLHVETRTIEAKVKIGMISDCLSALKYLHENGYTHRDIKSMNILVTDDYLHCKLGDFGLALKEYADSSASVADHNAVGTLKYSPPQVVEGNVLNVKQLMMADVYSVAVVGIELMTEEEPYDGMNQFQVRKAILDGKMPGEMAKIENDEVRNLLEKALLFDAKERPTAAVLFDDWKQLME